MKNEHIWNNTTKCFFATLRCVVYPNCYFNFPFHYNFLFHCENYQWWNEGRKSGNLFDNYWGPRSQIFEGSNFDGCENQVVKVQKISLNFDKARVTILQKDYNFTRVLPLFCMLGRCMNGKQCLIVNWRRGW